MSISIEVARRIVEASKQRAREVRSPVSIAIVDAGGHLVLFERMMSPYGWATGGISIAKATTAVMFNQPTDAVAQWGAGIPGFASSMATMTEGKFIMAAGGWPIRVGGATIGGIGISGGNAPGRDDEIARAGLMAIDAAIPASPVQPVAPAYSLSGIASPQPQAPVTPSSAYRPPAAARTPQQGNTNNAEARGDAPTPTTGYLSPEGDNPPRAETSDEFKAQNPGDHS